MQLVQDHCLQPGKVVISLTDGQGFVAGPWPVCTVYSGGTWVLMEYEPSSAPATVRPAPSSRARSFIVRKLRGMKWFRWVVVWWVKAEVEGGEVERERMWENFAKWVGEGPL
jgi:hypothetical protein